MSAEDRVSGFVWVNAGGPLEQLHFYDGIFIGPAPPTPEDPTVEPQVRFTGTVGMTVASSYVGEAWFLDGVAIDGDYNDPPYNPPEEPQPRFTGTLTWDRLAGGTQEIEFYDGVAIEATPALSPVPTPMPPP